MTARRAITLLSLLLVGTLCACGGHGATTAALNQTPAANQPSPPDPVAVAAARQAAWVKLEQTPGVAGQDYDPLRITVNYLPGATVPPGWSTSAPAGGSAASQPNPQLRQNHAFEALTDAIAARYGLSIGQQVYLHKINFASFLLPAGTNGTALLTRLRSEAGSAIEAAVFTPLEHVQYTPNDPDFQLGGGGPEWSKWTVSCPQAWDTTKGSASVVIAVIDTGVRLTHEELSSTVLNPQTAYPSATCDLANNDKTIEDTFGHGTFIAGMICAKMDDHLTIVGVAPQCKVLPIKISNDGTASGDVLAAGALLADQLGAKVVNYSWGSYSANPNEQDMVNQLTADGVLFICAAGNDATDEDDYPTAYPNALSVGATDEFDNCTSFSNWGLGVDMAAPGQDLKSCGYLTDSSYTTDGAGTSFAAPMVAAGAGLLWSYKPTLTLAQVRNALVNTGPLAFNFALPIGRLDVAAALASVVTPVIPSASGLKPAASTTVGAIASQNKLSVSLTGAVNVSRVVYTLDLAPVGTAGAEDKSVESTTGGQFAAQFDLTGLKNQPAALSAKYYSTTGDNATVSVQPLWIFNQRGDIDGDGVVGSTDLSALQARLGKKRGDAGYVSFADSDQDGTITEADAAAIGYNFGHGAVKPGITAVTPLSGIANTQVAISGTVTGTGPLTYSWDFGGGAIPNTSALPAPTVTLGTAGSYSATLGITSGFGTATFPFTLTVSPRPGPSAVLTATPKVGLPPLNVNFDASGSVSPGGSIVKYEWSWDGDTTWEDTTTSSANAHSFPDLGSYTVRLQVTDDQNVTATTTVPIKVVTQPEFDGWQSTDLGPWGQDISDEGLYVQVCDLGSKPAVVWKSQGSTTSDIYVAQAKISQPLTAGDWRVDKIANQVAAGEAVAICNLGGHPAACWTQDTNDICFCSFNGSSWTTHTAHVAANRVDYPAIASVNGKPAIFYFEYNAVGYEYLYATKAAPVQGSDWVNTLANFTNAHIEQPYSVAFQLIDSGGLPFFQGQGYDTLGNPDHRLIAYAASSSPSGPGDWHAHILANSEDNNRQYGKLFDLGGVPSLAFRDLSASPNFTWANATAMLPQSAADWEFHNPGQASMTYGDSALIGGYPARWEHDISGNGDIGIATTIPPASNADWLWYALPANLTGWRLVDHGGGLPGLIDVAGGRVLYRYPTS